MATCAMRMDKAFIVGLDAQELETLRRHAGREGLSVTDAMADLVEYVVHTKACEIRQEEKEARAEPCDSSDMVGFTINWAKSGPCAVFGDKERQYIASVMIRALCEALTVCLYKMSQKGVDNVLEREDEGMGTGEPPLFVN